MVEMGMGEDDDIYRIRGVIAQEGPVLGVGFGPFSLEGAAVHEDFRSIHLDEVLGASHFPGSAQ